MSVIAVIFDFDDTLLPDSTSALLRHHGIDDKAFWSVEQKALFDKGYDQPMAYLNPLLARVGDGKPLGKLTNEKLREFGASLDSTWFPGLPDMFDDIRAMVAKAPFRDIQVEFYIVSGGLQEVIAGSAIVQKHFQGWYGCELDEDAATGCLAYVKRAVTFTEKTRFIYEINKGIPMSESRTKPHLVNQDVPTAARRIPVDHMIYVGDGLTDVPCFSLVGKNGGHAFAVFQTGAESAKQAFQKFLATHRVTSMHFPRYRPDDELGAVIRSAVSNMASSIMLRRDQPR